MAGARHGHGRPSWLYQLRRWFAHSGYEHNLWSDDVLFPLEPGIRLQLIGRITDQMAIEATGWGLQQWSVGRTIYGDPEGETVLAYSPWLQAAVFDNSLGYTYSSQVANVEINQRFKLFSIDPYRAFSWLWGVRYLYLSDDFSSERLGPADRRLRTPRLADQEQPARDAVGIALGLGLGSLRTEQRDQGGPVRQHLLAAWHRFRPGRSRLPSVRHVAQQHGPVCAFSSYRWRCAAVSRPACGLRAGYQYYGLTGLALGPRQLGGYDAGGTLGLDGLSIGLELTR